MNGIRFYLEFSDKSKRKSGGKVVAALVLNGSYWQRHICYEALAALFDRPNSPVAGTGVASITCASQGIELELNVTRKVRIVATIGPASQDDGVIEKLLQAGMDVARLNFSHGTHETHAARISQLRSISERLGRPLALLQDLQGPKIRVGVLHAPISLVSGSMALLYPEGASETQTTQEGGGYPS